jgi:hypothetical protein
MKYILIILTLASVPGLQSQAAPDKSRTCRILLLEPTRGTPKEAFLFDGKQSQKVSLSNKHFSNVIELPRESSTSPSPQPPVPPQKIYLPDLRLPLFQLK